MSELKHAAMPEAPDYGMIGFDLLHIGVHMIAKDLPNRERFIKALSDAAMLCFEADNLKNSMMELYKRMEGVK